MWAYVLTFRYAHAYSYYLCCEVCFMLLHKLNYHLYHILTCYIYCRQRVSHFSDLIWLQHLLLSCFVWLHTLPIIKELGTNFKSVRWQFFSQRSLSHSSSCRYPFRIKLMVQWLESIGLIGYLRSGWEMVLQRENCRLTDLDLVLNRFRQPVLA